MPLRPCLDCGSLTNGSRCRMCAKRREHRRDATRGTTKQRGLTGAHARMSRYYKEINAVCACTTCPEHAGRVCGRHGTPSNPITAGHIIARARGGTNDPANYQPECRRCNSAKGTR